MKEEDDDEKMMVMEKDDDDNGDGYETMVQRVSDKLTRRVRCVPVSHGEQLRR